MLPTVGITHNDAYPVEDGIVRAALAGLAKIRMVEMPTERLAGDQVHPMLRRGEATAAAGGTRGVHERGPVRLPARAPLRGR